MTLEVLICTFNERVARVADILLPPRRDVQYLVSFQYSDKKYMACADRLRELGREDVRLVMLPGKGLSANRNNALRYAEGDVLLTADDDVTYRNEYYDRILQRFEKDDKLDVACFQALTTEGKMLRNYPDFSFGYENQPRGNYFMSIEIALRRKKDCPAFDERYGLGAEFLGAGEEEVFLFDCFKRGWKMRYFPEVVVETFAVTTGQRMASDARLQRTKGAVLCHIHGVAGAWLRCLKYAMTHSWETSRWQAFHEMVRGIRYEKL